MSLVLPGRPAPRVLVLVPDARAVATGTLHPELVAFYMRTLGYDRLTTEAKLLEVAAGLREHRDARRAIEGGRDV